MRDLISNWFVYRSDRVSSMGHRGSGVLEFAPASWSAAVLRRFRPIVARGKTGGLDYAPAKKGAGGLAHSTTLARLRYGLSTALLAFCVATHASAADSPAIDGVTQPFLDVTLSAPVPGIISAEFFKEGQAVKRGDVILELDKRLEELEVDRRKAVMDQAKKDLESSRILVSTTKSVSKEELQKKETDYAVAAAEYGIAAEQLARRKVIAPFAGSISEITLQVGAASSPYQSLVRLVDTTRGYFIGQVEARALSGLHMDQSVRIQMDGVADPVPGRISFISPVVDAASGLAKVKAVFDNPDARIRPGVAAKMFVE